jgi:hypothetical protein
MSLLNRKQRRTGNGAGTPLVQEEHDCFKANSSLLVNDSLFSTPAWSTGIEANHGISSDITSHTTNDVTNHMTVQDYGGLEQPVEMKDQTTQKVDEN